MLLSNSCGFQVFFRGALFTNIFGYDIIYTAKGLLKQRQQGLGLLLKHIAISCDEIVKFSDNCVKFTVKLFIRAFKQRKIDCLGDPLHHRVIET